VQEINRHAARSALENLMQGVAPSLDITKYISVGIDRDLDTFDAEYFGEDGLLRYGEQGTFKIVEAYYGGGKTHYLRSIEELAHRNGFASAFIELNKESCPLTKFDLIYTNIVKSLTWFGETDSSTGERVQGIENIIKHWIAVKSGEQVEDDEEFDYEQYVRNKIDKELVNLPVQSMRIAIQAAAMAAVTNDQETMDEVLVYLQSGKIASSLRKRGVLEPINAKNGVLAIRSLAVWLRGLGAPGLLLIMDEGDRSLSISSAKDKATASNNLVQLINETLGGSHWPGVMFLYSIPSWSDFQRTLSSENQALEQRLRKTGFPNMPPSPRIDLEERHSTDEQKYEFCIELGEKICSLFNIAYPDSVPATENKNVCAMVAAATLENSADVSYRRLFVQTLVQALYHYRIENGIDQATIENLIENR